MDMIGRIRHLHIREKKSEREISRITGLSRNTVAKWLHGEVDGPPKSREHGKQATLQDSLPVAGQDRHRLPQAVSVRPSRLERREPTGTKVSTNSKRWAPLQSKSSRRLHSPGFKAQVLAAK